MSKVDESAHRSPSPWPRQLGVAETQATPLLALMPQWSSIARKWWDPRPRIAITIRARIAGGTRTYRFWSQRAARMRVQDFLDAHRRIYHAFAQIAVATTAPPLATRSGGL